MRFTLNRPIDEIQIGSLVELNKSHKHIGRSVFSSSCNLIKRAAERVTSVDMSEVPVMLDKYNHNTGEEGFVLRPEVMVMSQPIVLHDPASEATKVMKDLLAAHQTGVCGLFIAGRNVDGIEKSEYLISRSINNWITEKPSVERKIVDTIQKVLPHFVGGTDWKIYPILKYKLGPIARKEADKLYTQIFSNGAKWRPSAFIANVSISASSNIVSYLKSSRVNPTVFAPIYPDFISEKELIEKSDNEVFSF